MFCDHAFDFPAHELKRDVQGCVLCPRCAVACPGCGRVFHLEDVNADSLCDECEGIDRAYGFAPSQEKMKNGGTEEDEKKSILGDEIAEIILLFSSVSSVSSVLKKLPEEANTMVMALVKPESAPGAADPAAEAQHMIADIRRLETDLGRRRRHVAAASERIREIEEYTASRREALCRLVFAAGGALAVPGFSAPLRVKVRRDIRCSPERLAPWLAEHAPRYVRQVVETRIDRRALKKALRFRGSKAFLEDIAGPVPGVAVTPAHSVVIPAPAEDQKTVKGDDSHGRRRKTIPGASAPQIRA